MQQEFQKSIWNHSRVILLSRPKTLKPEHVDSAVPQLPQPPHRHLWLSLLCMDLRSLRFTRAQPPSQHLAPLCQSRNRHSWALPDCQADLHALHSHIMGCTHRTSESPALHLFASSFLTSPVTIWLTPSTMLNSLPMSCSHICSFPCNMAPTPTVLLKWLPQSVPVTFLLPNLMPPPHLLQFMGCFFFFFFLRLTTHFLEFCLLWFHGTLLYSSGLFSVLLMTLTSIWGFFCFSACTYGIPQCKTMLSPTSTTELWHLLDISHHFWAVGFKIALLPGHLAWAPSVFLWGVSRTVLPEYLTVFSNIFSKWKQPSLPPFPNPVPFLNVSVWVRPGSQTGNLSAIFEGGKTRYGSERTAG